LAVTERFVRRLVFERRVPFLRIGRCVPTTRLAIVIS
jgi:hypothetical protein